jgi:hypothetical protein
MTTRSDAASSRLPAIDEARLDAVESGIFEGIARERADGRRRRRRIWTGVGAAAAVVVIALAIVPGVGLVSGLVTGGSGTSGAGGSALVAPVQPVPGKGAPDSSGGSGTANSGTANSGTANSGAANSGAANSGAANSGVANSGTSTSRDVVTTATATVRVDDVRAAATRIADTAKSHGGYVESLNIGQPGPTPLPAAGSALPTPEPAIPVSGAWITVRVPAAQLDDVVSSLSGLGQVEAYTVNRQDVTDQAANLRAQVAASQASVTRLTELMAKAASVSDLLAAETALTDRQAMLQAEQQQLNALDDQVAMSTLTVSLVPRAAAAPANPAGFGSGLIAGWNSLVAWLNGVVVAIGFLLPWLAVAAVIGLIVWGVIALVRRRRRPAPPRPSTSMPSQE